MNTRPSITAGWARSGSPNHFSQTTSPLAGPTTSKVQLSVLKTTKPSATTAAVGPSSVVPRCHTGARARVESVKVIAAEASADEDATTGDRRRRHGALWFQCDPPAG